MFERYTERARRVVFFARYEASQFGSPYIETEHLLLGLLREDKGLSNRFLRSHASVESIRKQVEGHTTIREKVSTSVDLPLSNECKRVLAYAAEEAERLSQKHIGPEHLLLGLLREEKCFAAEILHERGLRLSTVREELTRVPHQEAMPHAGRLSSVSVFSHDLTQEAREERLDPLVGREPELDAIIEILCTRKTNNPLLVGEHGVGKTAIVNGLAQRIADGEVPPLLSDKRILLLDLSLIVAAARFTGQLEDGLRVVTRELAASPNAILFIDDLCSLTGIGPAKGTLNVADILKFALAHSDVIVETTPTDHAELMTNNPWLGSCFRVVNVAPATGLDAVEVLFGVKERYEKFHGVSYTDDAIKLAILYAERYLPDRHLPGKAVEVLDAAGTRVKLRQAPVPAEMAEVQKRIKFIVHRMENAIANHEFEKARFYSDEERKGRENLRALREKYHLPEAATGVVGREEIEAVISNWTGLPVESLREEGGPAEPTK